MRADKITACNFSMLQSGMGFRNESVYSSGVRDVSRVIDFETNELGNTDIYMTLKLIYDLKLDMRLKHDKLNKIVLQFLEKELKIRYTDIECIWLCSDLGYVNKHYRNCDNDIKSVCFKSSSIVLLSDLGEEGALIAYRRGEIRIQSVYSFNSGSTNIKLL